MQVFESQFPDVFPLPLPEGMKALGSMDSMREELASRGLLNIKVTQARSMILLACISLTCVVAGAHAPGSAPASGSEALCGPALALCPPMGMCLSPCSTSKTVLAKFGYWVSMPPPKATAACACQPSNHEGRMLF